MSDQHPDPPGPAQLRAGRHGLPRAQVVRNQHERMLEATLRATSELGYAAMNVEDIIKRAGVSRRTFYEQFANKHEAFLAAFDASAGLLLDAVREAYEKETTFEEKVSSGFRAFLGTLAGAPEAARVCIVEALAAGPEAIERRTRVTTAFAAAIEENARDLPGAAALPPLTSETLVGGVYETVFRRICNGQTAELPGLVADLTEATLLPYVGAEAAAAHANQVRAQAAAL